MKREISKENLEKILESHRNWLKNEDKGERADLSNADLQDVNLKKADLRDANLEGADLRGAYLESIDLRGANLKNANLRFAVLNYAFLQDSDFSNANLRDANLCDAILSGANLQGANLKETYMHNTRLEKANLNNANLEYAAMEYANLICAEIKNTKFRGAHLHGVILPDGMFQIAIYGAVDRRITYDSINNNVICGSADNAYSGHLSSFKKYVETTYGEEGKTPNPTYYNEYMAIFKFFKKIRKAENPINIQRTQKENS